MLIYAFSLAWPILAIGTSVSFYFFLILSYLVFRHYGYIIKINTWYDKLFLLFPAIALLSLVFAPYMPRRPGVLADFQIWCQYLYWMVLALFIRTHGFRIHWYLVLKVIFWGVNFLIVSFYLLRFKITLPFFYFSLSIPRNAFIFQLLCLVPLCLLYIRLRYSRLVFYGFMAVYVLLVLVSEGRAGSIIILIECLVAVYLLGIGNRTRSIARYVLVPAIVVGSLFYVNYEPSEGSFDTIAEFVGRYNPRLEELIKGEGSGDLSYDKSWLLRKLMIEKAVGISEERPWLGVGLHHFTSYDYRFYEILRQDPDFARIRHQSEEFFNTRSAHNSYVQVLAETGYLGLATMLLIILTPVIRLLIRLVLKPSVSLVCCVGLLGISIHYYVISSITGAIGWFTLGVAYFFLENGHWISLPHSHPERRGR